MVGDEGRDGQSASSGDVAPLHIGLYSPDLPDSGNPNGIVTYSRILRDALRALGHSVTIVSAHRIEHADGRVGELPPTRGLVGRFRNSLEGLRMADGSHPWARREIVNAFLAARHAGVQVFEIEESFGWARRLVRRGVPIVERLHGPHAFIRDPHGTAEQKRLGDRREAAELVSFNRVHAITSPSQRLIDEITSHYDLDLPITRAIPNPIPVASAAQCWNLADADPNQILFVGRFELCKGADVAIRAFVRAHEQRPSLKLVMVGPDVGLSQGDGTAIHFDDFAAREIAPEARDSIRYLGTQPPACVARLRMQSALTFVASRFENFPYSIAEAMAVGMPILTSDTFGGSELIRNGIDGTTVPIDDVDAAAEAILSMIGDPSCLMTMGQSAYARAKEWLSPERIAAETIAVYRAAIAST